MKRVLTILFLSLSVVAHSLTIADKAYDFFDEQNYEESIKYFQRYCSQHPKNIEGRLALQMSYAYGMHAAFDIDVMRQCMLRLDSTSELANDFLIEYIEGCEVVPRYDIIQEDGVSLLRKYSIEEADKISIYDMIARSFEKTKDYKHAYQYYKLAFPYYLKHQKELDALPYVSPERGVKWALVRLKSMRDSINEQKYYSDYQSCLDQALLIGHDDIIETYQEDISAHGFVGNHRDSVSYFMMSQSHLIQAAISREANLRHEIERNPFFGNKKDDHLGAIANLAGLYGYYGMYPQADSCLNMFGWYSEVYFPKQGDRLLTLSWLCNAFDKLCLVNGQNCGYGFFIDSLLKNMCDIDDNNIVSYVRQAKYSFSDYHRCNSEFVPHMYDHYMNKAWLSAIVHQNEDALRSVRIADSISSLYLIHNNNSYLYEKNKYGNEKYLIQAYVAQMTWDNVLLRDACERIIANLKDKYWDKFVSPHSANIYTDFFGTEVYSEYDRQDFHNQVRNEHDAILSYAYMSNDEQVIKSAYNLTLFQKSLLLTTQRLLFADAQENDENFMRQIERWKVELMTSPLNHQYDSLQNLINQAEAIWIKENFNRISITPNVLFKEADDIRLSLKGNETAIEFVNFQEWEGVRYSPKQRYCAILLRNNGKNLNMIPLFEEQEVRPLINTVVDSATNKTYSYDYRGHIISQKVWSKILPYVKPGETIYFAPSGILHQLAIEALPYDESHTMGDVFNLVRLSSTREIVTRKDELPKTNTATLYGGIQYNMDADEILAESEAYKTTDLLASRGIESDTLNRGTINYLKGTKAEAENINAMLKQNNLQVQLFTAKNANEESFKALSGKHRNILHIATHGFYWSDSTAQKKDYFSQRMLRMNSDIPSLTTIDPLNRCGLLFAGAQTAWSGHSADLPEGVQDGILTAKEISLLDLRDADLVVLSACETGKGEITGDGVFGLQRAFKQAGAQTIVMSLWPVNDAATQLLMTEFYRNWITNHQSKREAFRNAQNTVRAKYEEPVYWAGFIMLD